MYASNNLMNNFQYIGLSVAFFQDVYTTSESKPANICVSIIDGSIQRPQPISLTLTTSPGSASRKYNNIQQYFFMI